MSGFWDPLLDEHGVSLRTVRLLTATTCYRVTFFVTEDRTNFEDLEIIGAILEASEDDGETWQSVARRGTRGSRSSVD